MMVHIFGATSFSCIANFVLQKTANDNNGEFDKIVTDTVKQNFSVDDYLKAVRDEKEGVLIFNKSPELLDLGGFHLRKWVSNSLNLMISIPEEDLTLILICLLLRESLDHISILSKPR